MEDLISRAAAINEVEEYLQELDSCTSEPDLKLDGYKNGLQVAIQELKTLPAVDAVPVVRCRDCKYYDRRCFTCENDVLLIKIDDCGCHPPFRVDDDWFCADGERRDES